MDIRDELNSGKTIYELPLRVTYYARVSTDNEQQMSSIVNQVDYFNDMIKKCKNWIFVPGYIDEGISGKDAKKRENFIKMIKDGISKKYDLILTKSVSRFARNTIDSIKYTDLLKSKGICVFFINDNINTFYSDSEFRLTLMASIAQDEVRKLSESVKFGLRQSINRGVVLGNDNILGYRKDKGKLVIDDKEALIVKDVFEIFITDGYSYSGVARVINKKYNKRFDSTSIKRILTNYKYKGYYCGKKSTIIDYKNNRRKNISPSDWVIYKDYEKVPPIVREEVWDKANEIVFARVRTRNKSRYSNKVFCDIHNRFCRYVLKKYKDKVYNYFVCSNCCSVSEEIIHRICMEKDVYRVIIKKENDYLRVVVIWV